jgi:hypothetical protein
MIKDLSCDLSKGFICEPFILIEGTAGMEFIMMTIIAWIGATDNTSLKSVATNIRLRDLTEIKLRCILIKRMTPK